jgi:peptidoglycan/xylan/chitin deacetylase (PgdA/CDA1 family)
MTLSLVRSVRAVLVAAAALATTVALAAPAGASPAPADAAGHQNRACRNGYVGLTFDDGPSPTAPDLLKALKREGLRATMFNQGNNALARPELVRAERRAKMWVGNHTFTHPDLTKLEEAQRFQEIASTQWVLRDITHREPTLFRPPYGSTNDAVRADADRVGVLEVLWTVDSEDWNGATVDQIVAKAATLTDGGIILMHDWPPNTVQAIPGIARVLRDQGLCAGKIVYTPEAVPFGATTFHAKAVKP